MSPGDLLIPNKKSYSHKVRLWVNGEGIVARFKHKEISNALFTENGENDHSIQCIITLKNEEIYCGEIYREYFV